METSQRPNNDSGYMIILTMIIVFVLMGTGLTIASTVAANYASTKRATYVDSAISVAEAGVSDTAKRLKSNLSFTGYPDSDGDRKQFYDNDSQGRAEYATVVTDMGGGVKRIVSNGYVYANRVETNAANATNKKSIEVTIQVGPPRNAGYSIVAGPGGLTLRHSNVVSKEYGGGDVFSIGDINMINSDIGTSVDLAANRVINVYAENRGCGPAAGEYPVPCSTTNPVKLSGVGYGGQSRIYGDVCANNQTDGSGMSNNGIIDCSSPSIVMPTFNKQAFADRMTVTKPSSADGCPSFGFSSPILPANTKYIGDKSLGVSYGGCNAILQGDIYIDGDFTVQQFSNLIISDSLGTTMPTIVVNGKYSSGGVAGNGGIRPNSSGTGARVISFASSDSACSSSDSCITISNPNTAKASESVVGIDGNFSINQTSSVGSILWAYFGTVNIYSGSEVGAVVGQKVNIEGLPFLRARIGVMRETPTSVGPPTPEAAIIGGQWSILSYRQLY